MPTTSANPNTDHALLAEVKRAEVAWRWVAAVPALAAPVRVQLARLLAKYGELARIAGVVECSRLHARGWRHLENPAERVNGPLIGAGLYACETCGAIFRASRGRSRQRRSRGTGRLEAVAIRCPTCVREEANGVTNSRRYRMWWKDDGKLVRCEGYVLGCAELIPSRKLWCSDRCRMRVARSDESDWVT